MADLMMMMIIIIIIIIIADLKIRAWSVNESTARNPKRRPSRSQPCVKASVEQRGAAMGKKKKGAVAPAVELPPHLRLGLNADAYCRFCREELPKVGPASLR